jgi:hypothetical protein
MQRCKVDDKEEKAGMRDMNAKRNGIKNSE